MRRSGGSDEIGIKEIETTPVDAKVSSWWNESSGPVRGIGQRIRHRAHVAIARPAARGRAGRVVHQMAQLPSPADGGSESHVVLLLTDCRVGV